MITSEASVLLAMAGVSETFIRLGYALRQRDDVTGSFNQCWLREANRLPPDERLGDDGYGPGFGLGFRIEWYAEGTFVSGRMLTFSQEIAWHSHEWFIEAAVNRYVDGEEQEVLEFPQRYAITADEVVAETESQARLVEASYDYAIRKFYQLG